MSKPFTSEEIKKAVKRLKNNTSPGADNVKAELLKYGNDENFEEIATYTEWCGHSWITP